MQGAYCDTVTIFVSSVKTESISVKKNHQSHIHTSHVTHLLILIGCDSDERRLLEGVRVEGRPAHTEDIVGLNNVHARLVLVHRVEDDLKNTEIKVERKRFTLSIRLRFRCQMQAFHCSTAVTLSRASLVAFRSLQHTKIEM